MKIKRLAREVRETTRGEDGNLQRVNISLVWQPPLDQWVKLNIDGTSQGNFGPASFAGVFRDSVGGWILGYGCKLRTVKAIQAEVEAILMGLQIAKRKRIPKLIIKSDSQGAIELVRNPPKFHPSLTHPIRKIVSLFA
ncbi:hypothetical protein S245_052519 [Arachis hypogaea]